ncbi:hypothetical protein ERJ70_08930 [Sediminibacillus dalangtanensis]|uniref:Magnesium transporter MgtE intracellular domain-containing protein n=1 Tax=Sediminibacillus dalangtanensis TaxID=2729421 RepID=A0ABX7VUG0_9BACI|nr:hypothetical protein [Sediminibacillus dalangtanensis]QTM99415.1 hypothetical protein ERJ70_08930 [Sediminibacillus dalangtanensis]
MANKSEYEKKKPGILQWILFILIPLILAATIALIIMVAAGIDVGGFAKKYANQVPGVSSLVSEEEKESGDVEQKRLTAAIDSRDEQIEQLESELEAKEADIKDLNEQINTLNQQLKAQEEEVEDTASNAINDISTSFQNMEAERAAGILANLEDDTALAVMEQMSKKTLGEILGEMDADEAARLTNAYAAEETQ